ncbi:hypothetical protein HYS10_00625 [Candidatus Collierbacteria bacterium]|nr:hypothetical protein [Candidatus Collierbacteria bacterium]
MDKFVEDIKNWYDVYMAVLGKEFEEKPSAEEIAAQEVEGYIEKIEKQAEKPVPPSPLQPAPGTTTAPPPVYDDMGKAVMQSAKGTGKLNIVLPLDEEGIRTGLHHKVIDGIRWLAEWCVFIIKKYPGRVFYKK